MDIRGGKKVSREMYAYRLMPCENCDHFIDEDEVFHYIEDEVWCKNCVDYLGYSEEKLDKSS